MNSTVLACTVLVLSIFLLSEAILRLGPSPVRAFIAKVWQCTMAMTCYAAFPQTINACMSWLEAGTNKKETITFYPSVAGAILLARPGSDAWAVGLQNCVRTDIISPKK